MKFLNVVIVFVLGLVLLYFAVAALKVSFSTELFVHSAIRFVAGFVILGIGVFYAHVIRLKVSIYILLTLVLIDDVWDYSRDVDSFVPEMMLYSLFMMLWGAISGYVVMRQFKANISDQ